MANKENKTEQIQLKSKIEKVILECFRKAKQKKFEDLNFMFTSEKSEFSFLKEKISIFNKLDIYSQTFLSIHTRAKVALYEFQQDSFEGNYLELLRLILTLPEVLNNENLKSVKVSEKDITEISKNLDTYIIGETIKPLKELKSNTILVKEGINGKKLIKDKQKQIEELEELNDISFDDEQFEDDDLEDINL
jgi:hypothetical protein